MPPLTIARPDITLIYTFTCNPSPADITTTTYTITNIPHMMCFINGKYVIVRLADNGYVTQHRHNNHPQTTVKWISLSEIHANTCCDNTHARITFRINPTITKNTQQAFKDEVEHLNNVSVDEIVMLRNVKTPAMKIKLATIAEAENLLIKSSTLIHC